MGKRKSILKPLSSSTNEIHASPINEDLKRNSQQNKIPNESEKETTEKTTEPKRVKISNNPKVIEDKLNEIKPIENETSPKFQPELNSRDIRRRTTFVTRGKRATAMGPGKFGYPHHATEISKFYQFISPEIPPPQRFKQLVAWCIKRHLGKQVSRFTKANEVTNVVEKKLLYAIINGQLDLSWYNRPLFEGEKEQDRSLLHPQNIKNSEKKEKLLAEIEALEEENSLWSKSLEKSNQYFSKKKQEYENGEHSVMKIVKSVKNEVIGLDSLIDSTSLEAMAQTIDTLNNIEWKADALHDALNSLEQQSSLVTDECSNVLSKIAVTAELEASRNLPVDPAFLLMGLSKISRNNVKED
ncbi:hypothetical protein K502DRAFT_322500 [Neoconidiobolus thromboides FSU 785]|nr:hypothetical protein K502DRAFT_322500 [Neoconidiobolus thromboides FSU 785]